MVEYINKETEEGQTPRGKIIEIKFQLPNRREIVLKVEEDCKFGDIKFLLSQKLRKLSPDDLRLSYNNISLSDAATPEYYHIKTRSKVDVFKRPQILEEGVSKPWEPTSRPSEINNNRKKFQQPQQPYSGYKDQQQGNVARQNQKAAWNPQRAQSAGKRGATPQGTGGYREEQGKFKGGPRHTLENMPKAFYEMQQDKGKDYSFDAMLPFGSADPQDQQILQLKGMVDYLNTQMGNKMNKLNGGEAGNAAQHKIKELEHRFKEGKIRLEEAKERIQELEATVDRHQHLIRKCAAVGNRQQQAAPLIPAMMMNFPQQGLLGIHLKKSLPSPLKND